MHKITNILLINIIFVFPTCVFAQPFESVSNSSSDTICREAIRIMFYNVENLFDTFDDPTSEDEEFTPDGAKKWYAYRYRKKLNNIAKTIIAAGGWEPPDIIGLCEIENFQVLSDLTTKTMLVKYGYQIVHENSPDRRGIDNAVLFRPENIKKLKTKALFVPLNEGSFTRDILYTKLLLQNRDTVHFFVNHWPSRYGGKDFSEKKRIAAAKKLKSVTDSLFRVNPQAKIFIMGDFNDDPNDKSLTEILQAKTETERPESQLLYNLSDTDFQAGKGTLVYKEINNAWFLFDQMIVSASMLEGPGFTCKTAKSNIYEAEWLLNKGRPYRTYQGPIYIGGFSDHLPIFIDLCSKK